MERTDNNLTLKARKVNYDDYSGTFSMETRLEALGRQVLTHAKLVNVLNRSQDAKLRFTCKKSQEATDIVCRRLDKEGQFYRQSLRDRLAYLSLLRDFTQRDTGGDDVTYSGLYDLGLSRKELKEMIQEKIKDSTPSARRQKLCRHILHSRKLITVFDRTKSTSALLKMRQSISSRPATDQPLDTGKHTMPYSPRVKAAKLILPPITVNWKAEMAKKVDIRNGESKVKVGSFFLTAPNINGAKTSVSVVDTL
ncbi:hypothetical protein Btru_042381 [Bulinus truncatus]|nr:hypothetical protein Btru_042381 [Bulinus truncatus]